ncbi:branched-chain amino acid ABC transporter permease [Streptomyces sp. NPDC048288]|uniref:branched-chain amino acid ABC transporter permease n=1 Tax=Streptomyces sp. NPDC048288 TaxID=3365529 RepID=UPI00372138E1
MTGRPTPAIAARTGAVVAVAVVTAVLPLFLDSTQLTVYTELLLSAVVTTGVSLLLGYAGQISLGHGGFYAAGAYTAALMATHGLPSLLGLACAPLVAGLLGLLVGMPLLRLRGHYLAFATLAFQLILLAVIGQQTSLGGDIGLSGIPSLGIGSHHISGFRGYAWVAWLALVVVMVITRNIVRSRPGRGLRALATSEMAASSSGVPVGRYKLVVFGLSAAFAGLAGGIFAFFIAYVAPGSFGVLVSFQFVVMAVVGGLGTLWGPLIGASTITVLLQWLNDVGARPGMPDYAPQVFSYAVYALLLVLVVLFLPRGLVPAGTDALRPLARRLARERPESANGG